MITNFENFKDGDILPLCMNKKVKIVKKDKYTGVVSLSTEKTPGVYTVLNVQQNSKYKILVSITKAGPGSPGLWMAQKDKSTLYFDDFLKSEKKRYYFQRTFETNNMSKIIIGFLFKNAVAFKSAFKLYTFKVEKIEDEDIKISDKSVNKNINENKEKKEIEKKILDKKENKVYLNNNFTSGIIKNNIYKFSYEYKNKINNISIKPIISNNVSIFPISYGIPEEIIPSEENILNKDLKLFPYGENDFFRISSNRSNDLIKKSYYDKLSKSFFIIISDSNKDIYGKDDPIYYEAIAFGCIPILTNYSHPNEFSSPFIPKLFLKRLKNEYNQTYLRNKSDRKNNTDSNFDLKKCIGKFEEKTFFLNNYSRKYLTTKKIASYLLSFSKNIIEKVLFIAKAKTQSDFLLQLSLIHGLKKYLGSDNVVDYPKVSSLYKNYPSDRNKEIRLSFPYGYLLEDTNVSRGRITKRIQNKEFDLIIIMGIFNEEDKKRLLLKDGQYPMENVISENYEPSQIFFVDGNKKQSSNLREFNEKGILFSKE